MISNSILEKKQLFQNQYQNARPFKHVCIENFLDLEVAESLLTDFPPFDREKARNEFGEIGGKAVNTNLRVISPNYEKFYHYIFSAEFLKNMSELTGIPDLIGDPAMFGGGTHENCHGQELDPHVDFNYVSGGEAHRRVNLLIYLNKDWQPDWGGAIEIHSNPREPETNEIQPYHLVFNRAVVFETNEYSWHGFPRVNLPPERRNDSRKCISIYLYTKDRPADEIAGTHGTFYVQRPIRPNIMAGHTLTSEDVAELKRGFRNRDRYIEAYQKSEERQGRERDNLNRYIAELKSAFRLPTIGYVSQVDRPAGEIFHDGWIGPDVTVRLRAHRDITTLVLRGSTPDSFPTPPGDIRLTISGQEIKRCIDHKGNFEITAPCVIPNNTVFDLRLKCENATNLNCAGLSGDDREFGFFLFSLSFESETTTQTREDKS